MYRLFMAAAAYALFMPFFGPMLDHHFAERQHNHEHVYFGSAGAKHVHFYELIHPHSHTQNAPATTADNGPASGELPNEVIYFTSQDGAGQSFAFFAAPSLHVDLVFPTLGDNRFLLSSTGQDSLPPETFIPPPKRPPRI